MLKSRFSGICAAALAATFAASAVKADFHTVLIMDGGFFPPIVYVQPGDDIEFTNSSDAVQTIFGAAESWTSGEIDIDGTFVLSLNDEMPQSFVATIVDGEADAGEGDGDDDVGNEEALELHGEFTFEPAPI